MSHRRLALAVALLACAPLACKKSTEATPLGAKGDLCSATAPCGGKLVCTDSPVGGTSTPGVTHWAAPGRHYTFRAIAGVSMGAAGSSRLAAAHPEAFDAVGMLGGPLDAALLLRTIEHEHFGGFCPADKLEAAINADHLDGGNRMDRPDGIDGCTESNPTPSTVYSRSQRFNHWAYTVNGGHFDRDAYLDIFTDLTRAIGTPSGYNPDSPSIAGAVPPYLYDLATCSSPAIVNRVYDPVYSPHGEHRGITFCDGEPPIVVCDDSTVVEWCAAAALAGRQIAQRSDANLFCASHGGNPHDADEHSSKPAEVDAFFNNHGMVSGCWNGTRKVPFVLAIDMNGNGRRDLHEPLLVQTREPFEDVGTDGCPDKLEDGRGGCTTEDKSPFKTGTKDPNGDNYDALTNPKGTEGDWLWEQGEPYQDVGIDGVAGTGDYGEGDGKYTVSPGFAHWLDEDLRTKLTKLTDTQKNQLDIYDDGGIRDIFNLGAQAAALAGGVQASMPDGMSFFTEFSQIPSESGAPWGDGGKSFDGLKIDTSALTRNTMVLYGNPNASTQEIRAGDGDHVGTITETLSRFIVFGRWLTARWDAPLPPIASHGAGQSVTALRYTSTVLGGDWNFAVSLPPGYDDPANATKRYPVLFLLHGYGQTADDMSGTALFFNVLNNVGMLREMLVVYPSGQCCLTGPHGERSCAHNDVNGHNLEDQGWVEECQRGSFYVNRQGIDGTDTTKYGDAMLELMSVIDQRYRTLPPADGPAF